MRYCNVDCATTVHKAQVSVHPIVVMPFLMTGFVMLQRNLLYTGVTSVKNLRFRFVPALTKPKPSLTLAAEGFIVSKLSAFAIKDISSAKGKVRLLLCGKA